MNEMEFELYKISSTTTIQKRQLINFVSLVKRITVSFIDELVNKDVLCIMILLEARFVLELQARSITKYKK